MDESSPTPRDWRGDLPRLREFLQQHLHYPLVFATLSGADLYGFPSNDGDYDLRCAHVLPTRHLLSAMLREGGMDRTPDLTVTVMVPEPPPEMDFVSHDIGKFLRLTLRDNGYVLEQLLSPLIVETTDWHAELTTLAPRLITRKLYHHYRGFFANQEKIYHNEGMKKVKGLLYQYRVAMTGIHVLMTGQINANLIELNEHFKLSGVGQLVSIKTAGEAAQVPGDTFYLEQIRSLEPRLNDAYEHSRLPDEVEPGARAAVEDILMRCRRALGGLF